MKACIARLVRRYEFPDRKRVNDSYTHDLEKLVKVADLQVDLDKIAGADQEFGQNWAIIKDRSEESRYRLVLRQEAAALIAAIGDTRHGTLPWLQRHW